MEKLLNIQVIMHYVMELHMDVKDIQPSCTISSFLNHETILVLWRFKSKTMDVSKMPFKSWQRRKCIHQYIDARHISKLAKHKNNRRNCGDSLVRKVSIEICSQESRHFSDERFKNWFLWLKREWKLLKLVYLNIML